jgi:hypothetical protein
MQELMCDAKREDSKSGTDLFSAVTQQNWGQIYFLPKIDLSPIGAIGGGK